MKPAPIEAGVLRSGAGGMVTLLAPEVGLWREGPPVGRVLRPGDPLGRIERLGRLFPVVVPAGVAGMVTERHGTESARPAVGFKSPLLVVDPSAAGAGADLAPEDAASEETGMVLRAPMGGRFYLRAGPGKPPFVSVGDVIEEGRTVALLEVMKTFNRVPYGGGGLPSPARVKAILRKDDEDVASGDPILEVEDAS